MLFSQRSDILIREKLEGNFAALFFLDFIIDTCASMLIQNDDRG